MGRIKTWSQLAGGACALLLATVGSASAAGVDGGITFSNIATPANGINYEIIVVDNNSTDKTREVVESFIAGGHERVRYIFESKQGLSHARNAGIAAARRLSCRWRQRRASNWWP